MKNEYTNIKRIYHPYWKWECYKNGMWRKETKEYELKNLDEIIKFTSDHLLYGKAMLKAVDLWKYSCDNFLSNVSLNRKAYIGHAGCCIERLYPEYLVRMAWGELTESQRLLANKEAEKAIKIWEQNKKLKTILKIGKKNVTIMEYQMKLQLN